MAEGGSTEICFEVKTLTNNILKNVTQKPNHVQPRVCSVQSLQLLRDAMKNADTI